MVDTELIRDPNSNELSNFIPLATRKGRYIEPETAFLREVAKYQLEAIKKGLPFAHVAAITEWKDFQDTQKKEYQREGFIQTREFKIDWDKFSDLNNFDLIDEGEKLDDNLTKKNNYIQVYVKFRKYKFKSFKETYTVEEDGNLAIERSREKLRKVNEGNIESKGKK